MRICIHIVIRPVRLFGINQIDCEQWQAEIAYFPEQAIQRGLIDKWASENSCPVTCVGEAQVLELVRQLADNGLAVVLISHNMNDVFAVADRISALYLGRMAAQVKASDVTRTLTERTRRMELVTGSRRRCC